MKQRARGRLDPVKVKGWAFTRRMISLWYSSEGSQSQELRVRREARASRQRIKTVFSYFN